jgi:hypothetical protein
MRRVALLSALFLLLAAGPAAAAVRHPVRTVHARGVGGTIAVDGVHLVAYTGGSGRIALFDDRTGSTRKVGLGRTCNRVAPIDASDGFFLVNCGTNGPEGPIVQQVVFDARTGTATDLPLASYEQIGSEWVEGTTDSAGRDVVIYTNWHTGETRSEGEAPTGEIRTPFDLDSPNLDAVALAAKEFVVGSSLALEQVRSGRRYSIHLMGRINDKRLRRCARACHPVSMKGGLALWMEGSTKLFGYGLRTRRRFEWRVSDSAIVRGSTARRVYYLTPSRSSPQNADLRSFRWR